MRSVLSVLLAFFFCVESICQTGPGAMLPGIDAITGWRTTEEMKIWSKENLRSFMKDEPDIVKEYGFDYAVEQNYSDARKNLINVKVYVMNNSFGSCGLFMRYSKNQTVMEGFGNSAFEKPGEFGFWKHLYYVRLTSDSSGDTITDGFKMIAAYIDKKIRSKGVIPDILDYAEGKPGNITIFKGPLALSEIYYFSPLNIFFVQEGVAIENGNTKEIILKYADNNEAVRRLTEVAGILGEMSKFSDFIMVENFSFAMKDRDRKRLVFRVAENCINITIK